MAVDHRHRPSDRWPGQPTHPPIHPSPPAATHPFIRVPKASPPIDERSEIRHPHQLKKSSVERVASMPPKRKEGEASKPSSTNASAAKPNSKAAGTASAPGGDESSAKKPKYVKEDPGVTSKQFSDSAKAIPFSLGEDGKLGALLAEPTTFSTGSYGWKGNGKIRVKLNVDGQEKEVLVQVGLNLTVSGSKPDSGKATNGKRGRPRKNPAPDGVED